ncbi:MAG TPA: FtsX-like permease family protein, partial [Candidatus Acidoferrales bacterium]|nr:FtsX-like permease family protein [Candidatus Acidoferrales bacterium]
LVRGLHQVATQNPGFATRDVMIVSLDLTNGGYDAARADAFLRQFQDRLSAVPGVTGVARSADIPGVTSDITSVTIPGAESNESAQSISGNLVSASYFQTMDVRLVRGHVFTERDSRVPGPLPAVISSTMARTLWPGADSLDKTFLIGSSAYRIVGIAQDAQNVRLGQLDGPFFYAAESPDAALDAKIFVHAESGLPAVELAARQIARQLDPNLTISTEALETALEKTLTPSKTLATLVGVMGLLAMALAVVGVSGVVAYAAARRTREIGIRKALGARTRDVLSLLLRNTATLVAIGLALGLGVGAGASQILSSSGLLFGLSAFDPVTYLVIGICFAAVALTACYIPARRATRVDPLVALRHE